MLTAISDAIPYPSAALAEADLAVTRRILQIMPARDRGLRARWLSWLATTLAQVGRPPEALPPVREAVEAYVHVHGSGVWPPLTGSLHSAS